VTALTSHSTRTARVARRLGGVLAAAAVNALLWGGFSAVGVDFVLSDPMGTAVISLPVAVVATTVSGLLGWAALAVLGRLTRRAATLWTGLAAGVALASVVPVFLEHANNATQIALTVLHLAVAAVLIPAFRRTVG
jgi:hypothetical protein